MIKYGHVLNYVARTPWAMLESKMQEFLAILAFRASGQLFTAEEIRAQIGDEREPMTASKNGAVAVIPLRGIIAHRMGGMNESSGGASAERFTLMVNQAASDESIGHILLDVDSPGGTIPGVMEAADAVWNARQKKPVTAVANSMMASAAYWITSQASEIVAIPSAMDPGIGSIGIFLVHADLTAALEKEGVKVTIIRAGKNKAEGNPWEPLSDETLGLLTNAADAAKSQFVKAVARGRGITPAAVVADYGDGRAFTAKEAKANGLINRIATMDEMMARLLGKKSAALRAEADVPLLALDPARANPSVPLGAMTDGDADADRRRRFRL